MSFISNKQQPQQTVHFSAAVITLPMYILSIESDTDIAGLLPRYPAGYSDPAALSHVQKPLYLLRNHLLFLARF